MSKKINKKQDLETVIQEEGVLSVANVVEKILKKLSKREQDILSSRFGFGKKRLTLDKLGKNYNLTRERVRQIESASLKKIDQLDELSEHMDMLSQLIKEILSDHGGIMEKEQLFETLNFFVDEDLTETYKNQVDFLICKLLKEEVVEFKHPKFKKSFKLKDTCSKAWEELAIDLEEFVQSSQEILKTEKVLEELKKFKAYLKYQVNLVKGEKVDLSQIYANNFCDCFEKINQEKNLFSFLKAVKNFEQNKFGYWGNEHRPEIKPKTINDKIYLVLKEKKEPMHFASIAEEINKIGFDHKNANPATVHNELILDDRYVLIGRGLYGLAEWGLKKGTVSQVVIDLLKKASGPLSKDEIIKKVLETRRVRENTVILALADRNLFVKKPTGYTLKS